MQGLLNATIGCAFGSETFDTVIRANPMQSWKLASVNSSDVSLGYHHFCLLSLFGGVVLILPLWILIIS